MPHLWQLWNVFAIWACWGQLVPEMALGFHRPVMCVRLASSPSPIPWCSWPGYFNTTRIEVIVRIYGLWMFPIPFIQMNLHTYSVTCHISGITTSASLESSHVCSLESLLPQAWCGFTSLLNNRQIKLLSSQLQNIYNKPHWRRGHLHLNLSVKNVDLMSLQSFHVCNWKKGGGGQTLFWDVSKLVLIITVIKRKGSRKRKFHTSERIGLKVFLF